MAPQLWMLRHGEAVPHDSKPDFDRELTPRGRAQSEAAGRALAAWAVAHATSMLITDVAVQDRQWTDHEWQSAPLISAPAQVQLTVAEQ